MEGLGQLHGIESSPDFPAGLMDFASLEGASVLDSASAQPGQTGLVHMAGTGQGPGNSGTVANRSSSWSNLLDLSNGPLGWLLILTLLYLGLISLHVSTRIGR